MCYWFDPTNLWLVFIPTMLLSLGAQLYLSSAYNKWSKVRNSANWTGAQVGSYLISQPQLSQGGHAPAAVRSAEQPSASGIHLERTDGRLTDHYDPRSHTVRMSDAVATQPSVMAMAVVAHELGHAQQHQQGSALIAMRNVLVPAVRFSPQISYLMIFLGLILNVASLMWIGIIVFGLMVIFVFLTLPVEIDASRRGMRLLSEGGLLKAETDSRGSRNVLTAAASTYLAAAVTALVQLFYRISVTRRRR